MGIRRRVKRAEGKEPSAEREEQRGRDQEELPAVWKNNYLIA